MFLLLYNPSKFKNEIEYERNKKIFQSLKSEIYSISEHIESESQEVLLFQREYEEDKEWEGDGIHIPENTLEILNIHNRCLDEYRKKYELVEKELIRCYEKIQKYRKDDEIMMPYFIEYDGG